MEKNPRRTAVNGAFCGCSSSRIGAAEKGEYMAYCENCGAPLSENVRFCGMCGAPVNMGAEAKKYCSNCHAELDPGAVFCAECGYQVAPGARAKSKSDSGAESGTKSGASAIRGTEADRRSGRALPIFKHKKQSIYRSLQQVFTDL